MIGKNCDFLSYNLNVVDLFIGVHDNSCSVNRTPFMPNALAVKRKFRAFMTLFV